MRDDNRRVQPGENWFHFLDRVDDVYFGRVRALIEEWFAHLPSEQAAIFRSQFVNADAVSIEPPFFELYVHELLRRLDFELVYEPELASTSRRPDFRASGAADFFVEVRVLGDPEDRARSRKLRQAAIEPLRNMRTREFTIDLSLVHEGVNAPPTTKLVKRIETWLASLDREEVARLSARGGHQVPELVFEAGDWVFRVRPIARSLERVNAEPLGGAVSGFPGRSSWGGNSERLVDVLKKKAGRYGELGLPFVIACSIGDVFIDEEDIADALFGSPDASGRVRKGGLWSDGANSRVSAVIMARNLVPNAVASVTPILWRNPGATYPFDVPIPPCAEGQLQPGGTVELSAATIGSREFFELSAQWPGPERSLRVRAEKD